MAPHDRRGDMFFFCSFFVLFCFTYIGWNSFPPENSKRLCGLQSVTRASIDIVASRKWEKFPFWVNYLFKTEKPMFSHIGILCMTNTQTYTLSWTSQFYLIFLKVSFNSTSILQEKCHGVFWDTWVSSVVITDNLAIRQTVSTLPLHNEPLLPVSRTPVWLSNQYKWPCLCTDTST